MEKHSTITQILAPKVELKRTNNKCCMCNNECGAILLRKAVSPNFTNYNILKNDSGYVCLGCYHILKEPRFRRSSWIANQKEIIFFKNNQGLRYLLHALSPPFIFGFTQSFKKHLFLFSSVNYSAEKFIIGTDFAGAVLFEKRRWAQVIEYLDRLYKLGFSKEDLKSLSPSLHRFKNIDIKYKVWHTKYVLYLRHYNNNPVYEIILKMIYREDNFNKNKAERVKDDKQK